MAWERTNEGLYVQAGSAEVERVFRSLQPDDVAAMSDDPKENRFAVRPSTDHRNRGGDIVETRGCITKNYAANPVVFFGHASYGLPIGQTTKLRKMLSGPDVAKVGAPFLYAECLLAGEAEGHAEAQLVANLVRGRFIRTASYGATFYAYEEIAEDEPDGPSPASPLVKEYLGAGRRVKRWELLEWSFVGIPKNVKADLIARAGLDQAAVADDWTSDRVAEEARQFLDGSRRDRFMRAAVIDDSICVGGVCGLSEEELERRLSLAAADIDPDEDAGFDHTEDIFGASDDAGADTGGDSDAAGDEPAPGTDPAVEGASGGDSDDGANGEEPEVAAGGACSGCAARASADVAAAAKDAAREALAELAADIPAQLEAANALTHQLSEELRRFRESAATAPAPLEASEVAAAIAGAVADLFEDRLSALFHLTEDRIEAARTDATRARLELARYQKQAAEPATAPTTPADEAAVERRAMQLATLISKESAKRLVDEINGVVQVRD